jgi:CheY-like chemotaxis protein
VAHDFNNVLTAIHGYGELLLFSLGPGDVRREDVNEILKASDRAAGLTRQLLTFSRREVVAPRVLALDVVVRNIGQMLRRLIGEHIVFSTVVPDGIWPVRADAGQMDQVIMNLAVNARDAMPQGGSICMELANVMVGGPDGMSHTLLAPGPYVRLSVTDTGTGMDAPTVQRIFEPFFTTKSEGHGTGLGLATVYGIVDQAGGTIDVVTAVGRGTTFHVLLPRCDEPVAALEASVAPAAVQTRRSVETVLLVEDDPGVNALIGSVLRNSGYTVLNATNGAAALEIVRTYHEPIHLLLADVVMPGMNGREVSEHVTAARPGTPVLFMSGYPDDEIVRQGVKAASVYFIQKPFSMDALAEKIRAALARR